MVGFYGPQMSKCVDILIKGKVLVAEITGYDRSFPVFKGCGVERVK